MKITNASSKTISLLNGKAIRPKQTVTVDLKEGTDLYTQVISLKKAGILEVN